MLINLGVSYYGLFLIKDDCRDHLNDENCVCDVTQYTLHIWASSNGTSNWRLDSGLSEIVYTVLYFTLHVFNIFRRCNINGFPTVSILRAWAEHAKLEDGESFVWLDDGRNGVMSFQPTYTYFPSMNAYGRSWYPLVMFIVYLFGHEDRSFKTLCKIIRLEEYCVCCRELPEIALWITWWTFMRTKC